MQDSIQLEKVLKGIEENLEIHKLRADKAEEELRICKLKLESFNKSSNQNSVHSEDEMDWKSIKEKNEYVANLLKSVSIEAKSGIDLILKNVSKINEISMILKSIDRVSEYHE